MKTKLSIMVMLITLFAAFTGCEKDENSGQTGTMSLSLTDAPIDDTSVTGVYITITGLQYHKNQNSWETFEGFEGPQTFNLLELTDSISELLGSFEMDAGQYNQLRFMLDAPERGQGTPTSPGCYLEFDGGERTEPLYVPSGGQTGYKAVGAFRVPSNGTVEITADFDARKSVREAGTIDRYILKPTIRLIVNDQAGSIVGDITNMPQDSGNIVIYAYENDTYSDEEAVEPSDEENRFPNAVSSDMVSDNNSYRLDYLAPVIYDLIVTINLNGEFQEVLKVVEDVKVESRKTTNQPIEL